MLLQRLISMQLLPEGTQENGEVITPPDFSELRKMTVEEPKNKFVPPQKDENQTE
ncbi:MAG: hypothetical protein Q4F84_09190 [Fibrobacter sp.]|nr:hypothetical protein [Fibrobacter sp.]